MKKAFRPIVPPAIEIEPVPVSLNLNQRNTVKEMLTEGFRGVSKIKVTLFIMTAIIVVGAWQAAASRNVSAAIKAHKQPKAATIVVYPGESATK